MSSPAPTPKQPPLELHLVLHIQIICSILVEIRWEHAGIQFQFYMWLSRKKGTSCTRWAPSPVVSFFRSTIHTGEKKNQGIHFFLVQFIGAPIYTSIYNDRIGGPPGRRKYCTYIIDAFIPSDLVIWNDILVDSLGFRNDGINPGILKRHGCNQDVWLRCRMDVYSKHRIISTNSGNNHKE